MSAVDVIKNLITLGVQVGTAATKSGQTVTAFLSSPDFAKIEGSVNTLLASLKPNNLQDAIDAIDKKESDLLAGRDITALSIDEVTQFHALVTLERQAVAKLAASQSSNANFLTVLVNDVLPVLIQVAKIVLPIL